MYSLKTKLQHIVDKLKANKLFHIIEIAKDVIPSNNKIITYNNQAIDIINNKMGNYIIINPIGEITFQYSNYTSNVKTYQVNLPLRFFVLVNDTKMEHCAFDISTEVFNTLNDVDRLELISINTEKYTNYFDIFTTDTIPNLDQKHFVTLNFSYNFDVDLSCVDNC